MTLSLTIYSITYDYTSGSPPLVSGIALGVYTAGCWSNTFCTTLPVGPGVYNYTISVSPNSTYIVGIGHQDGIADPLFPPQTDMSFGFCLNPLAYVENEAPLSQDAILSESLSFKANPERSEVRIQTKTPCNLQVIEASGRILCTWEIREGESVINYDFLPSGIYLVRDETGLRSFKLLRL